MRDPVIRSGVSVAVTIRRKTPLVVTADLGVDFTEPRLGRLSEFIRLENPDGLTCGPLTKLADGIAGLMRDEATCLREPMFAIRALLHAQLKESIEGRGHWQGSAEVRR